MELPAEHGEGAGTEGRDAVAVVGLGRFGAGLTAEPAHRGAEMPAIDIRRKATRALDIPGVTFAVADATDAEVLRELGGAAPSGLWSPSAATWGPTS
ncbi:NAD-binding protein [Streptosporangium roseum]|uniref:NAD-binding protein n=1 Tax=Streptosporangium roseum TaxID=2001 RepID=UPI00331E8B51